MVRAEYKINIDIGATFTDGIFMWDNQVEMVKVPTTLSDPSACFMGCIEEGARLLQTTLSDMLTQTVSIRCAIGQPASIIRDRSGSRVGLIVTKGCKDAVHSRERDLACLDRLVPTDLVVEIDEEVDGSGKLVKEVRKDEVFTISKYLLERGAEAIGISLKNAYYNPSNEEAVKQIIDQAFPKFYLGAVRTLCSHAVCGRQNEELRTNTTIINLYLHKDVGRALHKIEAEPGLSQCTKPLLVMNSTGGLTRVAKTRPIDAYEGGPVAGILGSVFMGKLCGMENIIVTDMGGGNFHIGFVSNGEPETNMEPLVESIPIGTPTVRVRSVVAGGNSIAWIKDGKLQVGPRSTGSVPGPVCYDIGGTQPTVTDADLVLGYINPDYFADGKRKLNKEKAERAIKEKIADPLNIKVEEAALGIKEVIDAYMGQEINKDLSLRGYDPKDFVVLSYGGAGGTHCCGYAEYIGAQKIVIPLFSPVFCAFGIGAADIVHGYSHPVPLKLYNSKQEKYLEDYSTFNSVVKNLMNAAVRDMRGEGCKQEEVKFILELLIRYERDHEKILNPSKLLIDSQKEVKALCNSLYGKDPIKGYEDIELISIMLKAIGPTEHIKLSQHGSGGKGPQHALKGKRNVYWRRGWRETNVYDHHGLECGNVVNGPAVIAHKFSTCVIPEGKKITFDKYLNGIIENA